MKMVYWVSSFSLIAALHAPSYGASSFFEKAVILLDPEYNMRTFNNFFSDEFEKRNEEFFKGMSDEFEKRGDEFFQGMNEFFFNTFEGKKTEVNNFMTVSRFKAKMQRRINDIKNVLSNHPGEILLLRFKFNELQIVQRNIEKTSEDFQRAFAKEISPLFQEFVNEVLFTIKKEARWNAFRISILDYLTEYPYLDSESALAIFKAVDSDRELAAQIGWGLTRNPSVGPGFLSLESVLKDPYNKENVAGNPSVSLKIYNQIFDETMEKLKTEGFSQTREFNSYRLLSSLASNPNATQDQLEEIWKHAKKQIGDKEELSLDLEGHIVFGFLKNADFLKNEKLKEEILTLVRKTKFALYSFELLHSEIGSEYFKKFNILPQEVRNQL